MENNSPLVDPNNGQSILAALRDALAELYPVDQDARRVVDDAGLIAIQITFSPRPQTNWHNILVESIRQERLSSLLNIALSDYAANPTLLAAYGQYQLFMDQGGLFEAPQQLPADTSVVIAGDVNLNQGDFIGRDQNVRSIITGRDVIGSLLVTGDYNQVFVGDYERLQDAYLNPESVFDRVNLEHFTGRGWLLEEVDRFLQTHDRGYFILEADAGLGKTAFMAWLVKQRHYIHHFSELAPGQEGVGAALKNLAAQLALAFELLPEGVLPGVATRPDYLYDLLKQAVNQSQQDEKIVLVIDALDEAGTPVKQNVLGLPNVLPKGVYIIVSQRPVAVSLPVSTPKTPRRYVHLSAADTHNWNDMQQFLERSVLWPGIQRALQANTYTEKQFIITLLDKCQGIWIYLHYVIHEIERGERSPLELEALPDGISQYYSHYWQRWRDADENEWDAVYLLVLTTLAVAREAISCRRLIEWSGIKYTDQSLRRLLERQWRPFLAVVKQDQQNLYRFYHTTLQEFFSGQLAQDKLSSSEIEFIEELSAETRKCHYRLVNRYLKAWGGWEAELNGLQDERLRDIDDRYGLRHLTAHLEASGRVYELHRLLRIEWVYKNPFQIKPNIRFDNVWYTIREAVGQTDGYIADIFRAWRLAEKQVTNEIDVDPLSPMKKDVQQSNLGLQCRYALIVASLNSLAANIRPELLIALIKKKIWLPLQSLTYAYQIPDLNKRVETLIALAPMLPNKVREDILQEALFVIQSIEISYDQTKALVNLAPHLSTEQIRAAISVAWRIKDFSERINALANLASYLSLEKREEVLQQVMSVIKSMEDDYKYDKALANLVIRLAELGQPERALATVQKIEVGYEREGALANLVIRLAELGQPERALAIAHNIESDHARNSALVKLAPHLVELEQVERALDIAESITDHRWRANALGNLVIRLAELGQPERALAIAHDIESDYVRDSALANLVPRLVETAQYEKALAIAHDIEDNRERAKALANLAIRLAELGQPEGALAIAYDIEDNRERAKALAELGQPEKALAIAHDIEDNRERAKALANLVIRLAELGQPERALAIAYDIEDNRERSNFSAALAPYLSDVQLQVLLSAVQRINDTSSQTTILANLAPQLAELGKPELALSVAQSIKSKPARASALSKMASHLPKKEQEDVLREAISTAQSIEDSSERVKTLAHLAPRLIELGQIERVLLLVQGMEVGYQRAKALANLVTRLAELGQIERALAITQSIESSSERAEVLVALAPQLVELPQIERVLGMTQSLYRRERAKASTNLASRLAELGQPERALTLIQSLEHDSEWARDLTKLLASFIKQGQFERALSTVQGIEDEKERARVLAYLAPHLSVVQVQAALSVAQEIKFYWARNRAMAQLILQLAKLEQTELALSILHFIEDNDECASILAYLAPYLSTTQVKEALFIARRLGNDFARSSALVALTPYLDVSEKEEILLDVLSLAQSVESNDERATFLADIAPYLSTAQIKEAVSIARRIKSDSGRSRVLASLAPHLGINEQEEVLQEALFISQHLETASWQLDALFSLAMRLSKLGQFEKALFVSQRIEYRFERTRVLADMASRLTLLSQDELYLLWCKTLPMFAVNTRADLLISLEPLIVVVTRLGGVHAIVETTQAIQDVSRWWP